MADQKSASVVLRLRPDDLARIDRAAEEDQRTRSSWLRRLILDYLDGKVSRASAKPGERA
jgi:predicted transcriptional regulator